MHHQVCLIPYDSPTRQKYSFLDPVSVTESKELCENINEAISQKKQNFAIVYVSIGGYNFIVGLQPVTH